jgi:hypothetical protein
MHTHWLAGGLWNRLGWNEPTGRVFGFLSQNLVGLAASELAWLLTSLRLAGVRPDHPLAQSSRRFLKA